MRKSRLFVCAALGLFSPSARRFAEARTTKSCTRNFRPQTAASHATTG